MVEGSVTAEVTSESAARDPTRAASDRRLLFRYRVMAFSTATLLIILVFVGIPLQLLASQPGVVNVVGTIHGFLYIAYLFVAFGVTRRLAVPKWQMALVLLAGTVPFCAFVAERKMTRRFDALDASPAVPVPARPSEPLSVRVARMKGRWLSRRALLLHLEVAIVAPGCAVAGWWQATRALAGNGLSWFYSVEWPIFAIIAIAGWWYLIHEDPEAYRARKRRSNPATTDAVAAEPEPTAPPGGGRVTVALAEAHLAAGLAVGVGIEFALGVAALVLVPLSRATGVVPDKGVAIYLAHSVVGLAVVVGSVVFFARARRSARLTRLSASIGISGVVFAGFGGLLSVDHATRPAGLVVMFLGAVVAAFGYLFPTFERLR